jgi:hypothetical protein
MRFTLRLVNASLAALLFLACLGNAFSAMAQTLQPGGTIDVRLLNSPTNPWTEPTTIFGLLGILGGLGGVLLQRYWHRLDERKKAEQDERARLQAHVFDSLRWFEGKTQKRSIGIAIIEGNWDQFPDLQPTWLAILTNQAVYLLAESGQANAAHEQANLQRILDLLISATTSLSSAQKSSIREAIASNRNGKGLQGLDRSSLDRWDKTLRGITA